MKSGLLTLAVATGSVSISPVGAMPTVSKAVHSHVELVPISAAQHDDMRFAITIKSAPGWHTYWLNPGDAGMPLKLAWDAAPLDQRLTFPTPERIVSGDIVTFGLPQTATIIARVKWTGMKGSRKGDLTWAECDGRQCALERASFDLSGAVGVDREVHSTLPVVVAGSKWHARGKGALLSLQTQDQRHAIAGYFFPNRPGLVAPSARQAFRVHGATWELRVPLTGRGQPPDAGVLLVTFADGTRQGYQIGGETGVCDAFRR